VSIAAVVLAAGGATRFMGPSHKLLTSFRGRPLVAWAVEAALGARMDETVVVTGAAAVEALLPPGLSIVPNPAWDQGLAASLHVAVGYASSAGHDAIVVGLADQPLIPASAWSTVARTAAAVAVGTYGGRRANPVRLAAEVWALLPPSGDAGARVLMASHPELVVEVACEGNPADVDTLEDLERWS
jgi:CTP:molybdopterin cytidylyltransferase MocA